MENKQFNKYFRFTSMGLQLGLIIWFSSLFGKWLDDKYPEHSISYFKIIMLLGTFGAMFSFIIQVISIEKNKYDKKK
jgi:hypothetical protein